MNAVVLANQNPEMQRKSMKSNSFGAGGGDENGMIFVNSQSHQFETKKCINSREKPKFSFISTSEIRTALKTQTTIISTSFFVS